MRVARVVGMLCLLFASAASPSDAAPDVIDLGAENRLEIPAEEEASRLVVRVSDDAEVAIGERPRQCPSPALRIVGTAEHVVVQLMPYPYETGEAGHVIARVGGQAFDTLCITQRLEAGTYVLDVVHSPGSVELQLDLPDLSGSVHVAHEQFQAGDAVLSVLPSVDDPTTATTIWGGGYAELTGRGSVVLAGWFDPSASTRAVLDGTCTSRGRPVAPEWLALGPACDDGTSSVPYLVSEGGGVSTRLSSLNNVEAGVYGSSLWANGDVPGAAVQALFPFDE